jgi:phospholipid/cholesterol/gamma-HCH transport system ATP-binding protein
MEMPLIEFRNVTKRFNENTVLDRANVEIYQNQITTIIGKSGSGKSVLLKHIIGLLSPDEGTILFRGLPVDKMKKAEWNKYRSAVSYMFQNNALFDSMSVFDNIALPLRQTTSLGKKEINGKVMLRVEQMELAEVAHKYPTELSGGMQKRVALARALVTDPAIVLFDEPTTGQDPIRKNMIFSMIVHYRKQLKFTAVLVSHDIPDVFFISDRILLLWEGKIAFHGTHEELLEVKHPIIAEYLESLEGLRNELTGLLSKARFRSWHAQTPGVVNSKNAALLFSTDLDIISGAMGLPAALEFLGTLGEHINKYFSPLGGVSVRHFRGDFLTILPHAGLEEAGQLLRDFAQRLEQKAFPEIQAISGRKTGVEECFEIFVVAGITEIGFSDPVEQIIARAAKNQEIIATYQCDKGLL